MTDTVRQRRTRRAILAAGFVAAIVIWVVAGPDPEDMPGYDPMQNKMYLHDLELYGGKANLLAAEFRDWFVGLWQGRNLAFTVAALTVLVVLVMRFVARHPAEDEEETAVVQGPWRDRD